MPWIGQIGCAVADALDVMPHPVAVDQPRAGRLGDGEHPPVDMRRHAAQHASRRLAQALGPVRADELVIAADAAGGDDHGLGPELELPDRDARARLAPRGASLGSSNVPAHAVDRCRP